MKKFMIILLTCVIVIWVSVVCWPQKQAKRTLRGDETVTIIGAVQKPGNYPWKSGLVIDDIVMQSAGGFDQFADARRIKVMDAETMQSPLLRLQELLYGALSKLDAPLDRAWRCCHLLGHSPSFDWLAPSPVAKAIVDVRSSRSGYVLEPGDVVIVEERLINF